MYQLENPNTNTGGGGLYSLAIQTIRPMALLKPIRHFNSSTNSSKSWNIWKKDFICHLKALKYQRKRCADFTFLWIRAKKSSDSSENVNIISYPLSDLIETFDHHFKNYKNLIFVSYVFWNIHFLTFIHFGRTVRSFKSSHYIHE